MLFQSTESFVNSCIAIWYIRRNRDIFFSFFLLSLWTCCILTHHCMALIPGLHMGAGKSKPKEPGQRSMSLDGTIGSGSDSGHFHHLGPAQQTQTPNRSPAVGTGRRGQHQGQHQGQHHLAPTNTPELALFGGVDHTGTITSPQRGPLSGRHLSEKGLKFSSTTNATK